MPAPENKQDLSISMERGNLIALILAIPTAAFQFLLFALLHPGQEIEFSASSLLFFLVGLLISVILHEVIHAFTWMIVAGLPRSAVSFGVHRPTLSPYAHVNVSITVNAYRLGVLMPGFLLGILPYLIALFTGHDLLLLLSIANTTAAGGDWIVLWLLRRLPSTTMVQDHPTRIGCYVCGS